jgi:hypothetical protein
MENSAEELPELVLRLGESDGFRRSQVSAMSDLAAQLHGEIAVLRSRLQKYSDESTKALEQIIKEKDDQITEQSNTIVALRAQLTQN